MRHVILFDGSEWDVYSERADGAMMLCASFFDSLESLVCSILEGKIAYMSEIHQLTSFEECLADNDDVYAVIDNDRLQLLSL
jgi:hypothetical protein